MPAPGLIITYGNPSRGDDALGPAMFDLLEKHKQENGRFTDIDLITDFQLQIEHAVDLENRDFVVFVDAGVSCAEPFEYQEIKARKDDSFTTHAMSPASVLSVYQQIKQSDPPPSCLLTIRAYEFGLGKSMSRKATENLQESFAFLVKMDAESGFN
jgi:hydrogenase maturation protease